jgi:proline iminopeptidase
MKTLSIMFVGVASITTLAAARGAREGYLPGAGGLKLFYRVVGVGSPVIVVHGGPGGAMSDLMPDLQPLSANHRLIGYDQRGGGRSGLPEDRTLLDARYFVEDLEAVRRFFGVRRVTLLAHSFGSVLVGRYMEMHPDHVDRVIFMGAIGPRVTDAYAFAEEQSRRMPPDARERAHSVVRQMQGEGEVDRVALCREEEELEREGVPAGAARPRGSSCEEAKEAVDYAMKYTSRITFESFGDWDYTRSLQGVGAPLLVIYGDLDYSLLSSQEAWAKAVRKGRLLVVHGAGHNPHVDRPQDVFKAINTFLAAGWPTDAVRPVR